MARFKSLAFKINLIFAGLARDCERSIVNNVTSILSLLGKPGVGCVELLVAENDSKDKTRMILSDLSSAHSNIELNFLPSLDNTFPMRIQRIAYCRQLLFERARIKASGYETDKTLYIPVDLDSGIFSSVNSDIFIETCYSLVLSKSVDAIFPAGDPYYYDILALRAKGWCETDCLSDFQKYTKLNSQLVSRLAWYWLVTRRQKSLKSLASLGRKIAVDSAFGGFGIYCFTSLDRAQYYSFDWDCNVFEKSNEHVVFNSYIGSKVIDTRLFVCSPKEHIALRADGLLASIKSLVIIFMEELKSLLCKRKLFF